MKLFLFFLFSFQNILIFSKPSSDMIAFLKKFFTFENRKFEFKKLNSYLNEFDSYPPEKKEAIFNQFDSNERKLLDFLVDHRIFLTKMSLKAFLNFLPHFFLNNDSKNVSNHSNFGEYDNLLDEIEREYTQDHFDQLHIEEVFEEKSLDEKFEYLEGVTQLNGNQNYDDPDNHLKNNKYFKKVNSTKIGQEYSDPEHYFVDGKKIRKVRFIKDHHREGFKDFFDKFISEKFNLSNPETHQKLNMTEKRHRDHFDRTKKQHSRKIKRKKKMTKKMENYQKSSYLNSSENNFTAKNSDDIYKIIHDDEAIKKFSNNSLYHQLDKLINLTENLEEILIQVHPEVLEDQEARNLVNVIIETLRVLPNYTKVHEEDKFKTLKKFGNGTKTINFLQMEEKLTVCFIFINQKLYYKFIL